MLVKRIEEYRYGSGHLIIDTKNFRIGDVFNVRKSSFGGYFMDDDGYLHHKDSVRIVEEKDPNPRRQDMAERLYIALVQQIHSKNSGNIQGYEHARNIAKKAAEKFYA